MSPRKRLFLLAAIMAVIVMTVVSLSIAILYHTALSEETARLVEAAKSQARLIESVARFDRVYSNDFPLGARQATLGQIKDAHARYRGFGKTGEFTLSMRDGNQIVFLLSHRHFDLNEPKPVDWDSELAAPMRLALSGESGEIVGLDYRGVRVLAAYEPVAVLDLGIVAKIDLAEVRAPFVRAAKISAILAVLLIGLGVSLFFRVTNPLLDRLNETIGKLQATLAEVRTLRGIVPICAYCKKIRDDDGYWNQVEVYVSAHSNADFSHGICPDCMKAHFPEEYIEWKKKGSESS